MRDKELGAERAMHLIAVLPSVLWSFVFLVVAFFRITDGCSSRSTPKPRAPSSTNRPNITFHKDPCPPDYSTWYCLNGGVCFTVTIKDFDLYGCECAKGYAGPRCDYKDLSGSYIAKHERQLVSRASIASGVFIAAFVAVVVFVGVCLHRRRRRKEMTMSGEDEVDALRISQRNERLFISHRTATPHRLLLHSQHKHMHAALPDRTPAPNNNNNARPEADDRPVRTSKPVMGSSPQSKCSHDRRSLSY